MFVLAALTFSACGAIHRPTPKGISEQMPIPSDLVATIDKSERLGQAIYVQDKASWIATDALVEEIGLLDDTAIAGWLTLLEAHEAFKPTGTWLVEFFSIEEPPTILYQVHVPMEPDSSPRVERLNPPREATPGEVLLIEARQAAINSISIRRRMNTVVFPTDPDDPDGIVVYLLAAATNPEVMVLGKHYRIVVGRDDAKVRTVTELSKSEIDLPMPRDPDENFIATYVTHVVTDWPLETHVFASLLYRRPLVVLTKRGVWHVNDGKITFVTDEIPEDLRPLSE